MQAVGLTLTSVMSLVACGNSDNPSNSGNNDGNNSKEITKPTDEITIMFDNTVVTEANGGEAFYKYLIELTGLKLKFIRPDHNGYYDAVASAFASGSQPDVVILSSDYYALYASNGFLWNMTDAWENSDLKEVKADLLPQPITFLTL